MSDSMASSVYHRILTCRLIGKQQFKITLLQRLFLTDTKYFAIRGFSFSSIWVLYMFSVSSSLYWNSDSKILLHLTLSVMEFRMYMNMSIYHQYHHRRRQKRKDSGLMLLSQSGCYTLHFILVFSLWSELSSTYLSVCLFIYFEINNAWLAVYNF
jgi:hypothetical protein